MGWRKSSHSSANGEACVETGNAPGSDLVRDTTQQGLGPVLGFSGDEWRAFTGGLK